tara:strand:- start:520 stop:927 length:408 start_codon:yes stop_codon:yes gene_type:complete
MKILGIEHIGIAVKNLEESSRFWNKILGIEFTATDDVDGQGVITNIYDTGAGKIELLISKYPDSPIAKFLNSRGSGIHHICLQVDNIERAIKYLSEQDVNLIGNSAVIGAEGYKVIFIHPNSTGGVLVELAEKKN